MLVNIQTIIRNRMWNLGTDGTVLLQTNQHFCQLKTEAAVMPPGHKVSENPLFGLNDQQRHLCCTARKSNVLPYIFM